MIIIDELGKIENTTKQIKNEIEAGADIIVTGTVIEKHENPYIALKDITAHRFRCS